MFERYTETARRTIFFARYEASGFGSLCIETEHLLLGLLREDKALANRFLRSHAAVESIRSQIEGHTTVRERVSTSVDLPLSHECKRVLTYGAKEAERLTHKHIGAEHLLLGILREEKSFAAQLLREQGLTLRLAREKAHQSESPTAQPGSFSIGGLEQWLAECEAHGGPWTIEQKDVGNGITHYAIYAGAQPKENEEGQDESPAEKLAAIRKRIAVIVKKLECAIASHEFEKARVYSEEERKERANLRLLREQFHLEEPPPRVPFLCIEIIRDDGLSKIQRRCDHYIAEGVAEIWLLDPDLKRAYTVNQAAGLREFKGEILQIVNPPLKMDLRRIFR